MAQLTWKTIGRDDNSDLIRTLIANNQGLTDNLKGLGDTATGYVDRTTEENTKDFIGKLMSTDNIAERDAMIQAAEGQDFLDFQKIGEKSYDLGADERALVTQLAKEERANTQESFINERELSETKDLKTLDASIQRSVANQAFSDNLALENVQKINALDLAEVQYGYNVDVAKEEAKLLETKLNAAFERDQKDLIEKAKIATEKALAESEDEQEKLKIKLAEEGKLKEALKILELAHKENKQKQSDLTKANENYLKNVASIPSGLSGIFSKASGGLENATGNDVGATQTDIAAYASFRTATLKSLGFKPRDKRNRDMFDRWAADNITFNDNSLFGGLNDFTFINSNGQQNDFGKGGQTLIGDTIAEAKRAFLDSKVEIDLKNELFNDFYVDFEGGSANIESYDIDFGNYASSRSEGEALSAQGFKTYMYTLLNKEPGK